MVSEISGGDMEASVLGEIAENMEDAFEGLDSSQDIGSNMALEEIATKKGDGNEILHAMVAEISGGDMEAIETDSSQDIGSNRALEEIATKQGDGNEILHVMVAEISGGDMEAIVLG